MDEAISELSVQCKSEDAGRALYLISAPAEDLYVGKTISIIGEIGPNDFGGASICVDDLSQIQIIE